MSCRIWAADNLELLPRIDSSSVDLIYIDPPFNTGNKQSRDNGMSFDDSFGENFIDFMGPRFEQAYRLLSSSGSFFLHVDFREVHYCKVELDKIFGRDNLINEIIWHYDYGGRSKNRWPRKHDNILWYAKDRNNYTFNYDAIDRIPYMSPGLVGPEKAAKGKTPTDTWWHTIVPTNGKEKTGYPTQKPLGILERIVKVHSNPGDLLLDFFAGSGSFGEAALKHDRNVILVDINPDAVSVMRKRLFQYNPVVTNTMEAK